MVPIGERRAHPIPPEQGKAADWTKLLRNGFPLLLTIGVIDSATRKGFLTFLPFLLQSKGAGLSEIGLALTMVFAGGAAGKLGAAFSGRAIRSPGRAENRST